MPFLPLDHPEPFAATLGVMLYPGKGEAAKARAFAARWLAEPFRHFTEAGHKLAYDDLARIFVDTGETLDDLDERWSGGTATGELLKALFALFNTDRAVASWENTIKIAELTAARAKAGGARSALWRDRSRFLSVAHLWGAWSIREGRFLTDPEIEYDGYADFQSFLAEAEILRVWGQSWRAPRASSKPPLPPDVWRVPQSWIPLDRRPKWPRTGMIPVITIAPEIIETLNLRPAGRPRRAD